MIYSTLNPMKAKNLGPGKYADGQGLWLVKRSRQAGKWVLRIMIDGRRREMGLGPWPDISLADARNRASDARRTVREGVDPIAERETQRKRTARLTVADAIDKCFSARQAQLKGDGKAGRWLSPLQTHVIPAIGELAIEDVDQHTLKDALAPIWHTTPESARKALNRISLTLKHAAALGLTVDLQATMKARALLGKQRHQAQHIPSMAYQDAPSFYRSLGDKPQMTCLALRFLMLTVARTGEIRFALVSDIQDDVLIVPAARTKTGAEHRIPLSDEALRVLAAVRRRSGQTLLFPSPTGKPMSDATIARYMERAGLDARPHGFRATFRTWAEEQTDASYEVKETILGHKVGSTVERAYQRSDLLVKRRVLLERWAEYLLGAPDGGGK
ncbi:MAG: tyrosine-type recombinase/integrase [Hyphomicrobiaceae bacterium]|nr:tyrosine-type recombinase/integrase [Hyphomicrobiaceae bacterium]